MPEYYERDSSSATLPPSRQRLRWAWRTGMLPRSHYLAVATSLLLVTAVAIHATPSAVQYFAAWVGLQMADWSLQGDRLDRLAYFAPSRSAVLWWLIALCLPPLCWITLSLAQLRFRLPARGWTVARSSGGPSLGTVLRAFGATGNWLIAMAAAIGLIWTQLERLPASGAAASTGPLSLLATVLVAMAAMFVFFGILHYAVAWLTWYRRMSMTRREWLAELKEQEGDPAIRSRMRQRHRELVRAWKERQVDMSGRRTDGDRASS